LSSASHEEFEELQLTCRQLDLAPTACNPPGQQIEIEIGYLELRDVGDAGASPRKRFDAREKLDERKGLGQIVVTASLEATDPVVHASERAQHEHGRRDALASHQLDDREPVEM